MATTPTEPSSATPLPRRQSPIPYNAETKLSSILPPLIFGTATFNHQYNTNPFTLDTTGLVTSALTHGIRAFDTSPYYGPAEQLLGDALNTPFVKATFPRESYCILTKVGRIKGDEFNYSATWVRQSIDRSLERLHTTYLDVVYCHDVEFVSKEEVLEAVRELRRIRDQDRKVRYIGISGYPLPVLVSLSEFILKETGEPLDAVQSYANYTLQNQRLVSESEGLPRFKKAGVDVVTNASPLGMGLLRKQGVPVGALGDFHPASRELRAAVRHASEFCDRYEEKIEVVALRWALESWLEDGGICGSKGDPAAGVPWREESSEMVAVGKGGRFGVSVIGVSRAEELEKTMLVWRSILDGREVGKRDWAAEWSVNRRQAVRVLGEGVKLCLGEWWWFCWDSPEKGFVNMRGKRREEEEAEAREQGLNTGKADEAPWLMTPAASPEPVPEVEERELPLR